MSVASDYLKKYSSASNTTKSGAKASNVDDYLSLYNDENLKALQDSVVSSQNTWASYNSSKHTIGSASDVADWYNASVGLASDAYGYWTGNTNPYSASEELQSIYDEAIKLSDTESKGGSSYSSMSSNSQTYTGAQTKYLKSHGYSSLSELEQALDDALASGTYDTEYGSTYTSDLDTAYEYGQQVLDYMNKHSSDYSYSDFQQMAEYVDGLKSMSESFTSVQDYYKQFKDEDEYKNGLGFWKTTGQTLKSFANTAKGSITQLAAALNADEDSLYVKRGATARSALYGESTEEAEKAVIEERQERAEELEDKAATQFEKAATAEELAKWQKGWVGKTLVDIGTQVPAVASDALVSLAGSTIGMPELGLATMAARAYGQANYEARQAGLSWDDANIAGIKSAAIEVLTEKLGGMTGKVVGGKNIYGAGLSDDVIESAVRRATAKAGKSEAFTNAMVKLAGMGEEGVEEMVSDILNPIADRILQLKDENGNYLDEFDIEEMLYDGLVGFAIGAVGTGAELTVNATGKLASTFRAGMQSADYSSGLWESALQSGLDAVEGTKARILAEKYSETLDEKGKLTQTQRMRYINALSEMETANEQAANKAYAEEQLTAQGVSKEGTPDFDLMTTAIAKQTTGQELNALERQMQSRRFYTETLQDTADNSVKRNFGGTKTAVTKMGNKVSISNVVVNDDGKVTGIVTKGTKGNTTIDINDVALGTGAKVFINGAANYGKYAGLYFSSYTKGDSMENVVEYDKYFSFAFDTVSQMDIDKAMKSESPSIRNAIEFLGEENFRNIAEAGKEAHANDEVAKPKARERKEGTVSYAGGEVDGVKYKGVKPKTFNEDQKAAQKVILEIARMTGINFVFYESELVNGKYRGAQGMYADNTIYVDINAGRNTAEDVQTAILRTVAHEMTHFIQQFAPAQYAEMKQFIVDKLIQEDILGNGLTFEDLIAQKKARSGNTLTTAQATDEVIADACEMMLKNSTAIKTLAEERPEEYSAIRAWLKRFFAKLKKALANIVAIHPEAKALIDSTGKYIDGLQEKWDSALVSAVKGEEYAMLKAEGGEDVGITDNNGHAMASLRTYNEGGRAALKDYLDSRVKSEDITAEERDDMLKQMEELYDICKQFTGKYALFNEWSYADIVKDPVTGNPVFSVIKANGDYAMNLDFSLVCKKRRTLDAVFNQMIQDGIMDDFDLPESSIASINDIIREHGFETACALCFVDSKRYRQALIADSFVRMYNPLLRSMVKSEDQVVDYFNFGGDGRYTYSGKGIDTLPDSELDFTEINRVLKTEKKGTVIYEIARNLKEHPEDRRAVLRGDFMSTAGFDKLNRENKRILTLYNKKKGAGGPKAAQSDVQYLNDIIKSKKFKRDKAYSVGGVRIQSFSDYVPRLVFDYMQMFTDLQAKKLPAHAYTKEPMFALLFGLSNAKINMSLVPEVIEDGVAPGLDKNGDYAWRDGQSFGSTVYGGSEAFIKHCCKIIGVKYTKGKDRLTAAEGYELAKKIQAANGYTQNCGTIAVGVSNEHIRKLLRDDNIRMVIPYHKSSLNHIVAVMTNIDKYTDYTLMQNTRKWDGEKWTKISKSEDTFNFNDKLKQLGDARAAADAYLEWCAKKGYKPKFDDFKDEGNYFKLLEDFTCYDESGAAVPQMDVKLNLPTEASPFGDLKSLIKFGLEEDAILQGKQDAEVPEIIKEIKAVIPKAQHSDREGATQYSYRGITTATKTDAKNLFIANEMLNAGLDSETVRLATGWFKSYDGKWRNEIDDSKATLDYELLTPWTRDAIGGIYDRIASVSEKVQGIIDYTNGIPVAIRNGNMTQSEAIAIAKKKNAEYDKLIKEDRRLREMVGRLRSNSLLLSDILNHPKLFKAYPQLKNIPVTLENYNGKYSGVTHGMNIGLVNEMADGSSKPKMSMFRTLMHEVQHVIQEIEGFAQGSSVEWWAENAYSADTDYISVKADLDAIAEKLKAIEYHGTPGASPYETAVMYAYHEQLAREERRKSNANSNANLKYSEQEMDKYERRAKEGGYDGLLADYLFAKQDLDIAKMQAKGRASANSTELYFRTAGEIEARDVAQRLEYSDKQRKSSRPDIDRDNAVFVENEFASAFGNKKSTDSSVQYEDRDNTDISKKYESFGFKDYDVTSAIYAIRAEKAKRGHDLVKIGNMPSIYRDLFELSGDVFVSSSYMYRCMVSKETAIKEGRHNELGDANHHYHNLGEEKTIDAILETQDPMMIMESVSDENDLRLVIVLDNEGENDPIVTVLSLYENMSAPGSAQRRNHVMLTVYEKSDLPDYAEKALKKGRMLYIKKGTESDAVSHPQVGGTASETVLKKNIAQFKKKVKAFKEKNKISYSDRDNESTILDIEKQIADIEEQLSNDIFDEMPVAEKTRLNNKLHQLDNELSKYTALERKASVKTSLASVRDNLGKYRYIDLRSLAEQFGYEEYEDLDKAGLEELLREHLDSVEEEWAAEGNNNFSMSKHGAWVRPAVDYTTEGNITRLQFSDRDSEGNIIPLSQRFDMGNNDIRYQERDIATDRELLSSALDNAIKTTKDNAVLKSYKKKLSELEELQGKLEGFKADLANATTRDERVKAENRINIVNTQIAREDAKLLRMEAMTPLKNVVAQARVEERAKTKERVQKTIVAERKQKAKELTRTREQKETALEKQHKRDLADKRKAVAKTKAKGEKQLEQYKEKKQKQAEAKREKRSKTKLKQDIQRHIAELVKLYKRGKDTRNVKQGLRPMAETLIGTYGILFSDAMYYSGEDLIRNGIATVPTNEEAEAVAQYSAILGEIDKLNDMLLNAANADLAIELNDNIAKKRRQLKELEKKLDALLARERTRLNAATVDDVLTTLSNSYEALKDSPYDYVAESYDEGVAERLRQLARSAGGTLAKDMSVGQLEELDDAITMIVHTIKNANRIFAQNIDATREELIENAIAELEGLGAQRNAQSDAGKMFRKFGWQNLKSVYAFEAIGSKTLTQLYNNIRAGEDTWAQDFEEAKAFAFDMRRKYGYDSWDMEKRYPFDGEDEDKFSLNLQQIMSLYAYYRREQASGHMFIGGFQFDEEAGIVEKGKLFKRKLHNTKATTHRLDPMLLGKIIATLDEEQKAFVEEMQSYLSDVMGAKGNEVSMAMYGVELFGEEAYFPLRSSKQHMEQNLDKGNAPAKIKNSGFTNATVPNANNPIILSEFMDVWSGHVNDMAMYHAFTLPLEDFTKVYGKQSKANEEDSRMVRNVRTMIQDAYTSAATRYVDNFVEAINSGVRTDDTTGIFNKLIGMFKKGAVFASASVVIQQPSAIARAFAYIDFKYFKGKSKMSHEAAWKQLKQYAPVAVIKEMGYFDTNMGRSTTDYITGNDYEMYNFPQKLKAFFADGTYRDEVISRAPAWADEVTWLKIWDAVKRETAAKNKGMDTNSSEFLQLAGERFTEVIVHTQVYDSVMSRSEMMRSKDGLVKMATSFMAEPTTSLNMLAAAIINGKRGNVAQAKRSITAVVSSIILNSILVSFVYAARDDDDDKTYIEKYIGSFTSEMIDGLNPATYVPILSDVWSIINGYDVERADMSVISDIISAIGNLDSSSKSAYRKVEDLVGSVGKVFGLPIKNIMRDVRAVYQVLTSKPIGETSWEGIGYAVWENVPIIGGETSKADKLYDAVQSGNADRISNAMGNYSSESDAYSAIRGTIKEEYLTGNLTAEEAMAQLVEYTGNTEDEAYFKVAEWESGTNSKYGVLKNAVDGGDTATIKEAVSDLREHGTEDSNIRSSLVSNYKDAYKNGTYEERKALVNALYATGLWTSKTDIINKLGG